MSDQDRDRDNRFAYWKANLKLIYITLAIWALVSYGFAIILVPFTKGIYLGNLQLGFWWAHQGSMFVFVILIFVYAKLMDKVDAEYGVQE